MQILVFGLHYFINMTGKGAEWLENDRVPRRLATAPQLFDFWNHLSVEEREFSLRL